MNIFNVLGVRYEVFHSRLLHWLWSADGDHGAGDAFWKPIADLLGVAASGDRQVDDEVKIDVTNTTRWRLADLLIRTGDLLILVENKVDPAYQDTLQVQDEIIGGKALADAQGRRFLFALIAPGPLTSDMQSLITANAGVFIAWNDLLDMLAAVPRDGLDAQVGEVIRQYFEFARRPAAKPGLAGDKLVRESADAIRTIVSAVPAGACVTAVEVWADFLARFPEHADALAALWADSKNYSSKSWFAATLQRWAANRDLIEETGEWQVTNAAAWGYPKVRVYRRLAGS